MELGDLVSTNLNKAQEVNNMYAQGNHGGARLKLEEQCDFLNEEFKVEPEKPTETPSEDPE